MIVGRIGPLFATILVLSLVAVWLTFTMIFCESYAEQWKSSSMVVGNVGALLEQDIARDIALYDMALKATGENFADPEIKTLPPKFRQRTLFSSLTNADGLASILVLDANGDTISDSHSEMPRALNGADKDYFQVHVDGTFQRELFVSHPFKSQVKPNLWTIGLSRRMDNPDGSFAGIVLGTLRLGYFSRLFRAVSMPPDSSFSIVHDDGTVLMQSSFVELGRNIRDTALFSALEAAQSGQFKATSPFDGIERLYAFRRVGRFPLTLQVGIPTAQFLAGWRWRIAFVAFGFFILSGLIIVLAVTLGLELHRRTLAERTLSELAATDGLTALANRRHFDEALEIEWRRALRDDQPLALLMVDGDYFKAYNDTYGHVHGDQALRAIADALRDSIQRPADLVARYGGEEFAVLLPGTDLDGALLVGEAVRAAVARLQWPHARSPLGRLTVSIGAASCLASKTGDAFSLVQAADFALYEAKEGGRDRVATSERLDLVEFNWRPPPPLAIAS